MINPGLARALVEQRQEQLAQCRRYQAESTRHCADPVAPGRLARRVPRWRITWSRTVLSSVGVPGAAAGGRPDRLGQHGSSLMIIITAYRSPRAPS